MRTTIVSLVAIVAVSALLAGCAKDDKPLGTGTETAHPERSEAPQTPARPMYTSYGEPMKLNQTRPSQSMKLQKMMMMIIY